MKPITLVLAVLLLFSGCTFRMGDLTIGSTKNLSYEYEVIERDVEGSDCAHIVLGFPFGSMVPNLDEAMDRAFEKVPGGNVLTDVVIYNDQLFTYIYNRNCIRVQGDVGRVK